MSRQPPRSDAADGSRPPAATSSSRTSAPAPGDSPPRVQGESTTTANVPGLEISMPELVLAARRVVQDADREHLDVNIIGALSADPITGPPIRQELARLQAAAPSRADAAGGAEGGLAVGVRRLSAAEEVEEEEEEQQGGENSGDDDDDDEPSRVVWVRQTRELLAAGDALPGSSQPSETVQAKADENAASADTLVEHAWASPHRTVRLILLQESLRRIDAMQVDRTELPDGYWALAVALEAVIAAMTAEQSTLPAGHTNVLNATAKERALRCGAHPAAADGTWCRDCGRWNPSGRRTNKTACWRWHGDKITKNWTQDKCFPPNCHYCGNKWTSLYDKDNDKFKRLLKTLGKPRPNPDSALLRWGNRPLLDDEQSSDAYWQALQKEKGKAHTKALKGQEAVAQRLAENIFRRYGPKTASGTASGTARGTAKAANKYAAFAEAPITESQPASGPSAADHQQPSRRRDSAASASPGPSARTRRATSSTPAAKRKARVTQTDVVVASTESEEDGPRPPPKKKAKQAEEAQGKSKSKGKGKAKQVSSDEEEDDDDDLETPQAAARAIPAVPVSNLPESDEESAGVAVPSPPESDDGHSDNSEIWNTVLKQAPKEDYIGTSTPIAAAAGLANPANPVLVDEDGDVEMTEPPRDAEDTSEHDQEVNDPSEPEEGGDDAAVSTGGRSGHDDDKGDADVGTEKDNSDATGSDGSSDDDDESDDEESDDEEGAADVEGADATGSGGSGNDTASRKADDDDDDDGRVDRGDDTSDGRTGGSDVEKTATDEGGGTRAGDGADKGGDDDAEKAAKKMGSADDGTGGDPSGDPGGDNKDAENAGDVGGDPGGGDNEAAENAGGPGGGPGGDPGGDAADGNTAAKGNDGDTETSAVP